MTNTLCGDATCTEKDPGPTPSVGHVTGDMKRRESNETRCKRGGVFAGHYGTYMYVVCKKRLLYVLDVFKAYSCRVL